jgi:hypothetical protein
MDKKSYRVRNWGEYNRALKQRGSVTFWFNAETVSQWKAKNEKKRGRPQTYSEVAIEACVTMRVLFDLPYRQCEGFVEDLLRMMGLNIKVPSYTQICRRQKLLKIRLKHSINTNEAIHVVVDATGLKIFGEGEWKVRQHGYTKHRMWRKLHVGIDVKTKQFVMAELTDNHVGENKKLKVLLNQYEGPIEKLGGDKGYDSYECHETVRDHGAKSAILLQNKAKERKPLRDGEKSLVRDDIVRRMNEIGRDEWKKEVQYHKRSLVENAFFRFKTLFGGKLKSTLIENQKVEAMISCNILNQFTQLGMPISYTI